MERGHAVVVGCVYDLGVLVYELPQAGGVV